MWITVTAAIVIVAVTYAMQRGGPAGGAGGPSMLAGTPAASFPVRDLDGKPSSLAAFRGRVVLLNLWASWCTPCRQEMPDLERLYLQEAPRGLVVVGVNQGESGDVARAFVRAHGVTFPVLLDEEQRYGRAYAAIGLPTSVVVDRTGRIVQGFDGALTLAQMREAIEGPLRRT